MVTLAVDAMGGDIGPQITVPAVLDALRWQQDLRVLLFGDEPAIAALLGGHSHDRLVVCHSEQAVKMDDAPSVALRSKKKSSMALMLQAVK